MFNSVLGSYISMSSLILQTDRPMSAKSLSTSTLSLKFMQNAQRAKHLKEVELDRAEVKDDGKWEISQQVRDSWGISKETQLESSDVHEASYLPFLFSAKCGTANDGDNNINSVKKATGRRTFNKRGEDVFLEPPVSGSISTTGATPLVPSLPPTGRKVHPRPTSISTSGTPGHLRGFEDLKINKDSKTARQAVFENGGVGTDLRTQAQISLTSTPFMKPAGIDDPQDVQSASAAVSSNPDKIINSARQKKVKRERECDTPVDEPSDVATKPKKKKKKNPE